MSQSLCSLCFSWVFLGNAMISARGSGENSDASPCCFAISFAGSSAGASSLDGLNRRIGINNPCIINVISQRLIFRAVSVKYSWPRFAIIF